MSLDPIKLVDTVLPQATKAAAKLQGATSSIASSSEHAIEKSLSALASCNAAIVKKAEPETAEALIRKLQSSYGINTELKDKNLLNLLYEAVVDFCKVNKNDKMFEGLEITSGSINEKFFQTEITDKGFRIIYDEDPKTWENIEEILEELYNSGKISTKNKKYMQYASLGDYLNFIYNPYAYKVCKQRFYCNDSVKIINRLTDDRNVGKFNQAYIASRMSGVQCPEKLTTYFIENCGNADLIFPKITAKFHKGSNFDFKTIEEAQEFLKKYGIEAIFTDIKQANATASAVEDLVVATGKKDIFEGLVIKSDPEYYSDNLFARGTCHWDCTDNSSYITLNPAYNWRRAEAIEQENFDSLFHPTNRTKDFITHELVHYLDFMGNPKEYSQTSSKFRNGTYYNDLGTLWASKISRYASREPAEFCAEYVIGKLAGINYPECVEQEFLNRYNGVPISFPKPVINVN